MPPHCGLRNVSATVTESLAITKTPGEGLRHYTTPSIEWHASVVGQSVMRSGRMTVV
jgi:hypothetical protein